MTIVILAEECASITMLEWQLPSSLDKNTSEACLLTLQQNMIFPMAITTPYKIGLIHFECKNIHDMYQFLGRLFDVVITNQITV